MGIIQVLIGSLVLSTIHAAIPNHWIPLVAIGKAEGWSRTETLWLTAIVGGAHTSSTILVGIVIGLIGYKLSSTYEFMTRIAAPLILVFLGLVYLIMDLRGHHHDDSVEISRVPRRSKLTIAASLGIAMFFSPCIEIKAYYLIASSFGWTGILLVSMVYMIVTVVGMILLVDLGLKGVEKVRFHLLEHHEKGVTGAVLVMLGIFAYIMTT
jgi:hypothetical protein